MMIGLLAAITSIGFLLPKSSLSEYMMRLSLFFAPSFSDDANAWVLMIITLMLASLEKESSC